MTHPHQLAANLALANLAAAYPRLRDLINAEAYQRHDPTSRRRPVIHQPPNAHAAAQESALLVAERADRIHSTRRGVRHSAATPAPIRPALLDAQIAAETTMDALCWDAADLLRVQPPPYAGARPVYVRYATWPEKVTYLGEALRLLHPDHAARIGRQLERLDQRIRTVLGIGPDRRLLPGDPPCPACGRQLLRVEVSALDERQWTVTCAKDCACTGVQCGCRRPGREPGLPHIWPVDEYAANWGQLRPYLAAMRAVEAGAKTVDGLVYATAEQLGQVVDVSAALLRQWRRRALVDGLRVGREVWYRLDHVWTQVERARAREQRATTAAA